MPSFFALENHSGGLAQHTCFPSIELSFPPVSDLMYGFPDCGFMQLSFRSSMRLQTCQIISLHVERKNALEHILHDLWTGLESEQNKVDEAHSELARTGGNKVVRSQRGWHVTS
jgi:hypothetical protein